MWNIMITLSKTVNGGDYTPWNEYVFENVEKSKNDMQ